MNFPLLVTIIILAFGFDLINGFHDAANSIATVVSTKVLTPFQAVLWAAFFNVVAFLVFQLNVADTIAKTVDTSAITLIVILSGLIAAISWNLLTWYLGIPSSSSHTLVGGFAGAAIAQAGWSVVHLQVIIKIASFIFLAPLIGMVFAYFISIILLWAVKKSNPFKMGKRFKTFQLFTSALLSLGHGGNDAQKVMGIIAATLIVYFHGVDPSQVPHWAHIGVVDGKIHSIPDWVVMGCYTAIGAGTLMGGWRIVKTMGSKITKITPFETETCFMEMIVDFPSGARVDAHFSGFTVQTDQPAAGGGENSAPTPFAMFLSSIATCAGIYVLGFCKQRGLPTEGIRIVQRVESNRLTGMTEHIDLEIQVPPSFPEKYYDALIRSADQCKVKKTLENPPTFKVFTQVVA